MKKTLNITPLFAIVILVSYLALSCSGLSNNEPNTKKPVYSKEYWGEWLRMDMDETWYISNNAISVNGVSFSRSVSMTKQSARVIEVNDSGRKYYLFASRTATTSFSGRIAGLAPSRSAARSGIGGIDVIVGNLHNASNTMTVTTSPDGTYTAEGAIPGDEYRLEAGGQTAVIIPYNDGDDVGILTVTEGVNFKSRLIPKVGELDMTRLYADQTNYEFTLEITNVGTEDCTAAIYSLEFDEDLIVENTVVTYNRLGTIEPGRNKLINIGLACKTIHSAWEDKKIKIIITDPIAGKTWEDFVNIRFNKSPVHFVILSEREVNGVIISPNATATQFSTMWDGANYGTIASLPWSDRDYLVVFSGATADTEAVYSMGVNIIPDTNFSAFMDLARYEPNNTENAATQIMTQDQIISYLHKNDIDYYRINLSQSPASQPLSLIGALCRVLPVEDEESSIYMDILLKNNAAVGVSGTAVLRSNNENAVVEQDTVSFANIGGGKYRTLQSADGAAPTEAAYYAGSGLGNLFRFKSMASGGVFSFTITFTLEGSESWEEQFITAPGDSSSIFAGVSGANVAEKLQFIAGQSKNNAQYVVTVRNDETLSPQTVTSLGNNVTVTLRSASATNIKTIQLGSQGHLFSVGNNITLKLQNIVLKGISSNNKALVLVGSGGKMILDSGAKITSNNNVIRYGRGGGIYVDDGILELNNGCEIIGNSASGSDARGGGISIENRGSININGGLISNNTCEASWSGGGGVCIGEGNITVTMTGGVISKNYASYYGGGVSAGNDSSIFIKRATQGSNTSGIIYGSTGENANKAGGYGGSYGHAIYRWFNSKRQRNSTLGEYDEISSQSDVGWE